MIVTTGRPVTLIGGGTVEPPALAAALSRAPLVVAADGGADAALAVGLLPDAVIGDLDSLTPATRAAIPTDRLHRIAEQDSTDFEKCLTRIDAPLILAVGFGGPRLDHLLACLTTLVQPGHPPTILLTEAEVIFSAPSRLRLDLTPGTRLSIAPLGSVTGTSHGLRWPLDGITLNPATRTGTSNEATGPVEMSLTGPAIILIPVAHLDAAINGLTSGWT